MSENPRDPDAARAMDDARSTQPVDAAWTQRVDAAWTQRVDAVWRPDPLDAAGRARFDARLRERVAGRRGRGPLRGWVPVAAAAAVALILWGVGPVPGPWENGGPSDGRTADWQVADWEWELLLGGGELGDDDPAALPEEYDAIASVFLE